MRDDRTYIDLDAIRDRARMFPTPANVAYAARYGIHPQSTPRRAVAPGTATDGTTTAPASSQTGAGDLPTTSAADGAQQETH